MLAEGELMAALHDIFSNDATLLAMIPGGYHDETAPRDENNVILYPHIIVIIHDEEVRHAIGASSVIPIFSKFYFTIKAVDEAKSYAGCRSIMSRVAELLSSGYNNSVLGFVRRSGVKYSEIIGQHTYKHYGIMYESIAIDT